MKRARESDELEAEQPKKQATLGAFFRRPDGSPLAAPPQLHRLLCPYCDFYVESQYPASLPGGLRAHVQWRHPFDMLEASTRLQAALAAARQSIFDLIGMDPIPEEEENERAAEEADEDEANDEEDDAKTPKRKRHSYSIKEKFKALQALEKAEALVKASLADASLFFAVSVLDAVSRDTGIPSQTLKKWVSAKEKIRETYLARKRTRKARRLGSGRRALFRLPRCRGHRGRPHQRAPPAVQARLEGVRFEAS
jgi:hypothetical protein